LAETDDPALRARIYEAKLERTFRSEWKTLLAIDQKDTERFEVIAGLKPATMGSRFYSALQNHLGNGAMIVDSQVARKLLHGYFGLEKPSQWMASPMTWLRIVAALFPSREQAKVIADNNRRPTRSELARIVNQAAT
jgi:hypothetical protein